MSILEYLIFFAFIVVVIILPTKKEYEKKKIQQEKLTAAENRANDAIARSIGGTMTDRFFVECVLSECMDLSKEQNVEKAKIFANKYRISYSSGMASALINAMKEHEKITGRAIENRLAKKREAEKQEFDARNRYSQYYGKEKKIAMLRECVYSLREQADNIMSVGDAALKSVPHQSERNWAIAGGIASGIAGPAAGVAAAMDVQQQNVKIKNQNKAYMHAAAAVNMAAAMQSAPIRIEADEIERKIRLVQEKLISDMPTAKVMKKLEIESPTVEVSETGAFRVIATVRPKDSLYIFEDIRAVADGTIIAHVKDGNKEIGTAKMVFPVEGVDGPTHIEGIGLSGAKPGKKYTVTFTAYKLWLMEA